MNKFLAVVKHEYRKVVLRWSFLISTFLLPALALLFAFVPMIIFSLKGEPTRIAVADPSGSILPRLRQNLSADRLMEKARKAGGDALANIDATQDEKMRNQAAQFMQDFELVDYPGTGTPDEIRADLLARVLRGEIDAYLIVPPDIRSSESRFEFRSRRASDFVSNDTFKEALNDAVRSQRLADANISEEVVAELSSPVNFDAKGIDESGEEKDTGGVFIASFAIGLMIYITLAIYGQMIMGAVVEEKETRIAEILFSSARPFELMLGKLVGVGLAGLTQLAIWVGSAAVLLGFLALQSDFRAILASVPAITPLMVVYFLIFFLLGFFIYASIFALIGSMVTTVQEGGQFAFPPIMIMLAAFYFCFAVIRDPNSTVSFWVTLAPFLAPITMPVRILAEMPPVWQIALSVLVNTAAIAGLVWVASRVYRVGMLMYGKRATIPEVWKWIRQA
ncbi:MAG: ABC transporter permease [Pyrinomonadaceae bacterium]